MSPSVMRAFTKEKYFKQLNLMQKDHKTPERFAMSGTASTPHAKKQKQPDIATQRIARSITERNKMSFAQIRVKHTPSAVSSQKT